MDIDNVCLVKYSYKFSQSTPIIRNTIYSNLVSTKILFKKIGIHKFVSKKIATAYDILEYTIVIYNKCENEISNLYFKDIIPKNTCFIENSVKIDGKRNMLLNPNCGFYLGKLGYKSKIIVTFEVIILNIPCIKEIFNNSSIYYDYLINIENKPFKVSQLSNCVVTKLKKHIFKQKIINNFIKIKCYMCCIKFINCKSEIIATKLIESHLRELSKLIILIRLKYTIVYIINNKIFQETIVCGTVETLLVPYGVNYLEKINIKVNVIQESYSFLDRTTIFSNIILNITI